MSRKQYNFLREAGFPLPSVTTVNSRLRQFTVRQGSADATVALLQRHLRGRPARERLCILMFDEMKVNNLMDYDPREDQVVGPHKYLQQVMVRSLVGNWRLPLFFDFDRPMTADLLFDLVRQAESAGALVTGVVSDLGPTNQGLWRALGIAHDRKTSFTNPADPNRQVWVFADTPHLIKLARNHLLDDVLVLPGGGRLDRAFFTEVLSVDAGREFKLLPKLGFKSHVGVKGQARQRVRPAVQLLSNSVATAAERFLGRREEAEFIRVLDRGLDALNGQNLADAKKLRRGMSGDSAEHQKALSDLEKAVKLRFIGKRTLFPFQKGFLVTIASMRGLVNDVTAQLGPDSYVLTGRINQDPLESFFGLVRGKGGACLHPSPSEARCRVRNLTLMLALRLGLNPLSGAGNASSPRTAAATTSATSAITTDMGSNEPDSGDLERAVMDDFSEDSAADEVAGDIQEAESLLATASRTPSARARAATSSPLDPETGVSAEQYGLAHAAGYVAAKCRRIDPTLGAPTAQCLPGEAEPVEALWTRLISQGGLSVPSAEWLARFRAMEAVFCTTHHLEPDHISRAPRVVESLVERLAAETGSMDTRVIRRFVRLRTFIRLGHVNRELRALADELREARKVREFEG
ncbi:Transposable element P transposase [Amphibalanus amphitrite]|uniref:Transposable element P transposase n=1 Tax=Amphibalanus amphitrite TaxID=1232801 RepID=A0A6A4VED9_AMPAM|nr:Transposable element P transposase [Amphibalanus amphitrite]